MFAKLENGVVEYAPKIINKNGFNIVNPTAAQYNAQGYYPVIRGQVPTAQEGYYYSEIYEQQGETIVCKYVLKKIPTLS